MGILETEKLVIAVVSDFLHPYENETAITSETKFSELDLDSLDIVEIAMEIEDDIDVSLPYDNKELQGFETVRDLVAYIQHRIETEESSISMK